MSEDKISSISHDRLLSDDSLIYFKKTHTSDMRQPLCGFSNTFQVNSMWSFLHCARIKDFFFPSMFRKMQNIYFSRARSRYSPHPYLLFIFIKQYRAIAENTCSRFRGEPKYRVRTRHRRVVVPLLVHFFNRVWCGYTVTTTIIYAFARERLPEYIHIRRRTVLSRL